MKIILEMLYNFGMLASVSILSGFIVKRPGKYGIFSVFQGLLFGVAAMLGMLRPLVLSQGLIFDGRSVMISLCGLFFGPVAAGISALMAGAFRVYQGGPGTTMGVLVISFSAIIGSLLYQSRKEKNHEIGVKNLFLMGVSVHVIMILCMFALPADKIYKTIKLMAVPILLAYPLMTVLIGSILNESISRLRMAISLRISENSLKETNADLEASLEEIIAQEEEIREQYDRVTESEDRFRKIFEMAPIGINLVDNLTGKIDKVNHQFAEIVGRSPSELLTMDWMSLTYSEDLENNLALNKLLIQGKQPVFDLDKRYVKPDGSLVWVNIKVVDFSNDILGRHKQLCFVEDITEKKMALDAIIASEHNFRTLFEGSADAILILDETEIVDCNVAAINLFGLEAKASLIGKKPWNLSNYLQPDGLESEYKATQMIQNCLKDSNARFEWWHVKSDGSALPVEVVLTKIILNGKTLIHVLSRDITDRKAMEEKLQEMSYHDQLTSLYNRRFFEEELNRIDVQRNFPLTVMMADVNGLKLINDTFGHPVGDQLLIKVARIIEDGCRADDIISRIGGDEFAILLPQTSFEEAKTIVERINYYAAKKHVGSLDISISFGWGTKLSIDDSMHEILKRAEDNMYKKKLFESPSIRSKTIDTIIKTLYEKNAREELHSRRVSSICESMGNILGLQDSDVKELTSLGWLHDIGKIAIDEYLLNKPGSLSVEERFEIQRHPEIGYRILSTMNEMSEMAEAILSHHERWDGMGYPRGLKGEEIPLKARIISIADTYDAMTSDRSYRDALSHETAMAEIQRNSGIQFDPKLVAVFSTVIEGIRLN